MVWKSFGGQKRDLESLIIAIKLGDSGCPWTDFRLQAIDDENGIWTSFSLNSCETLIGIKSSTFENTYSLPSVFLSLSL